MFSSPRGSGWVVAAALQLLIFCRPKGETTQARPEPVREASATAQGPAPKAPGAQQQPDATDATIWTSHILLRHRESSAAVPFGPPQWRFLRPPPSRSRTDALALAGELARQVRMAPDAFAELAREHSEDEFTRNTGGSLGGVAAAQFRPWPEVLHALSLIEPGETSDPIETAAGYHIFQRRPPPLEESVSGSRIVIGYEGATWLARFLARPDKPVSHRSRAEALRMAQALYERAELEPDRFDELVQEHSEHRDALRAGDFGQWSTRDATPFPREVEILQQLDIGRIHSPIDSLMGLQIIKRTPQRARTVYNMTALRLRFDPDQPSDAPSSKRVVAERAEALAQQVAAAPELFSALQAEHCCSGATSWPAGRRAPALEQALDGLAVGQISTHAIEADLWYLIPKRLERAP
jgi:PPIC-type peptidyl-prolyl cis-trans isomerase-like protein